MDLKIRMGADPELFVRKQGTFVSGHGLIPGDKRSPHKVNRGAVQVDGMALEFNIDPSDSFDEFDVNLDTVIQELALMVPDYELVAVPVADFGIEYIAAQPREAKELGCDPDFNAWKNGEANPRPNAENPFRTGAGHIHLGWGEDFDPRSMEHVSGCCAISRQLDFYLGLPSVLKDKETRRRSMYGRAGCFRSKPYGVEYRVLSNFWVTDKAARKVVYDNALEGITKLYHGKDLSEEYGDIQDIINNSDETEALKLINRIGITTFA